MSCSKKSNSRNSTFAAFDQQAFHSWRRRLGRVVRIHQWERLSPHYIPPEWTSGRKLCSVAAPNGRHPRLKVTLVKVFVCRLSIKWVHLSSSDEIGLYLTSYFSEKTRNLVRGIYKINSKSNSFTFFFIHSNFFFKRLEFESRFRIVSDILIFSFIIVATFIWF